MFVDELTIHAKAGDGGDGVERWIREKRKPKGGPGGGNGGRGGDVHFKAVRDVAILAKYTHNPSFAAEAGQPGGNYHKHGRNGADCYIEVPIGSLVTHEETGEVFELTREGEVVSVLSGGRGGYGNNHFKGPENVTPTQATPGKPGEEGTFSVELRLIADVGLIGLPSAGKSTLLNTLTNARAKTGLYPFTTLNPNLGVFHEYILADIPGLIEGAADGKGLGDAFLKHISRTQCVVHCISLERENPQQSYKTIRNELARYDESLLDVPEIVVMTMADAVSRETADARLAEMQNAHPNVTTVSVIDDTSVRAFERTLSQFLASVQDVVE
jgi:GTP-binding protein